MISFDFEAHCNGCAACVNACPVDAISMRPGPDGFLYPSVDPGACVRCGLCESVCTHLNPPPPCEAAGASSYVCAAREDGVKLRSASGGAFYLLARRTLERGGLVCGCVWDEAWRARHILADTPEALLKMQGSKYVQSATGAVYRQVLDALRAGREVLMSGTPCQVAALGNYLAQKGFEPRKGQLLTAALICHGVASPGVWRNYVRWLERRAGAALTGVNLRDKRKKGYGESHCRYDFAGGASLEWPTYEADRYMLAAIVYNLCVRKSCGDCDCKGPRAGSDFILGDWYALNTGEWLLGASCVVALTDAAKAALGECAPGALPIAYDEIVRRNPLIEQSTGLGAKRDAFLRAQGDERLFDRCGRYYPARHWAKRALGGVGLLRAARDLKGRLKRSRKTLMRILVFGGPGIGDVAIGLPLARAIKMHMPGARIDYLTTADASRAHVAEQLLEYQSEPGGFDSVEHYLIRQEFWNLPRLIGRLRRRRYDVALIIQYHNRDTSPWAARIVRLIGCRSVGLNPVNLKIHYDQCVEVAEHLNKVDIAYQLLPAIGIEAGPPDIRCLSREKLEPLAERLTLPLPDGSGVVGLAVGTGVIGQKVNGKRLVVDKKKWAIDRWVDLANRLAARGVGVVFLGGGAERKALAPYERQADARVQNLSGCSIPESLAALTRCDLVVGADTGIMHCAAALGVRTLSLFGCTDPREYRPYGDRSEVIFLGLECSPCFDAEALAFCRQTRCMEGITVDMVEKRILESLADPKP